LKTYVIAIGGNALESEKNKLDEVFRRISESISELVKYGNRVVLVHGNGPQIGKVVIQNKMAQSVIEESSIDECGAVTQATIGYKLQKELGNSLRGNGVRKNIVTVLTQVIVDEEEFEAIKPTKPIGPFLTKEEASKLSEDEGCECIEDAGRGYRRVVKSPRPKVIEEMDVIRDLLYAGNIVIAGGGGGIPVIEKDGKLVGVDAVIDKDFTAELIATQIQADTLILLTNIENVAINYGKKNQVSIGDINRIDMEKYINEGQFSEGSMLPKVLACMRFVERAPGRECVIGTVSKLPEIISGKSGTRILY